MQFVSTEPAPQHLEIQRARFEDLSNVDLYDILRLRAEVFVMEQDCVYLDLDGRDSEPETEHLWVRDPIGVAATVRLLAEGDRTWSIGRVVARPDVRANGIASRLMTEAIDRLETIGYTTIRLGAQAHLADWYGRLGFRVSGPEYLEDGILHVPMVQELGR